jgi:multidrug efflux system outer membrane protein
MTRPVAALGVVAIAALVAACGALEPTLPEAQPAITADWPTAGAAGATTVAAEAAAVGWRDFFSDPKLEKVIERALANNRDLRVAVLNVERARALYRVQRADRVPALDATGVMVRTGGDRPMTESYAVDLGIVEYELDLFGRVHDLSKAALERYFAQEEARRSAQLALVAEVARAWLTLAADRERLQVAEATLKIFEDSYALTEKRFELGAVSALDVSQARTQLEATRADAARYTGWIAQDTNALVLLIGAPVEEALLPVAGVGESVTGIEPLPVGVPSSVLLLRPDVLQAEHLLRAQNANIGAARAAFFPSIKLTGAIGSASDELSGLFDAGTNTWSFIPQVTVPIFQGGRLQANLAGAYADRDIALARYEQSIQAGFREVADALALTSALAAQREALQSSVDAATETDRLSRARYAAGRDNYLVLLDAQRTLYAAQQVLIVTRLEEQVNRVTLYKALGGGWNEGGP